MAKSGPAEDGPGQEGGALPARRPARRAGPATGCATHSAHRAWPKVTLRRKSPAREGWRRRGGTTRTLRQVASSIRNMTSTGCAPYHPAESSRGDGVGGQRALEGRRRARDRRRRRHGHLAEGDQAQGVEDPQVRPTTLRTSTAIWISSKRASFRRHRAAQGDGSHEIFSTWCEVSVIRLLLALGATRDGCCSTWTSRARIECENGHELYMREPPIATEEASAYY